MKKVFLILLCSFTIAAGYSQKIVKEHYTVSGGLLGAANFTDFRFNDNDGSHDNIDYKTKPGWAAGFWLNFPVSKSFSIEPQVLYNSYRYQTSSTVPLLLNNGKIGYISVPLGLKFHAGNNFAFTLGPQVDFLASLDDYDNLAQKDDFNKTSLSAFGGFELFPHSPITVFGRYVHGFSNMDKRAGAETSDAEYKNQNIQVGLKLKLFGKKVPADSDGDGVADPKDKCPDVIGLERYDGCPIPDTDGDGINDEVDKCINERGTAKYNGCPIPDTDKDGINDEEDKCPNEAGTAKYGGCPIPDTDKDGLNDEVDQCPNEAGPASRNGCPVKDRDNDGVNDDEDRCPDIPGIAANRGCPEVPANVSKSLQSTGANITFGTGANNKKLTVKSNTALNQIVAIMNDNPSLKIRVEGHTDNAGNNDANMTLSADRADAVKAWLVSKGISEDRIKAEGFGETMPIADNNTAAGRTKNRRIEIKMDY